MVAEVRMRLKGYETGPVGDTGAPRAAAISERRARVVS